MTNTNQQYQHDVSGKVVFGRTVFYVFILLKKTVPKYFTLYISLNKKTDEIQKYNSVYLSQPCHLLW